MKPRILKTTKILAVAFTAAAGCAEGPTTAKPTADAIRAEAPVTAATAAPGAAAAPPSALSAEEASPPPPARPMSRDPALLSLANDLAQAGREKALAEVSRFRPLCDADGYPLVGNVTRKDARYQPSSFCATVREEKKAPR